jgi:hypothetical protein
MAQSFQQDYCHTAFGKSAAIPTCVNSADL